MSSAYEAMRTQMTGGTEMAIPRGLTLLIRQGLTSWLETCSSFQSVTAATDVRRNGAAQVVITPSLELASLLADMAIRHRRLRNAV